MIISRTPFRISFFGGGTDFIEHYRHHGGSVLCTSINKYAYLSVHRLSALFRHNYRASYAQTESVLDPAAFQHPLIRECLLYLRIQDRMEISHVSDLPSRTGLGTSSSFTVGLLHALHAFRNDEVNPEELAREAIIVERERVGDTGGHQDQYAAAYGGFNRIDFKGDQDVIIRPLQVSSERMQALQSRLLCFYLGTEMSAEKILQHQTERTTVNQTRLTSLMDLVNEAHALIESDAPLRVWGELMHAAWQIKKELASGITNPMVDAAYDSALRAGALGGKILGAGGRGFLCFYVEPEHHQAVRATLSKLAEVPFAFSPTGSQIIFRSPEPE